MRGAPPLRFLVAVVGGWVCLRAAMLAPGWVREGEEPPAALTPAAPAQVAVASAAREPAVSCGSCVPKPVLDGEPPVLLARTKPLQPALTVALANEVAVPAGTEITIGAAVTAPSAMSPPGAALPRVPTTERPLQPSRRWSASAWAFIRRGGGAQLAAGGTLGGSQIGARMSYDIAPLSVVARAYAPANRPNGGELALGLEWQPLPQLPVRLLAERRQGVGREGRSAFALVAHGGATRAIGPALLDGYAQAGVVGARSRDLFVDGSVAVALPLEENGRVKIGAALWGAAQPGVSRIDAGPQLTFSLPARGRSLRLTADWRMRIAGDAAPASGPALTLATEF